MTDAGRSGYAAGRRVPARRAWSLALRSFLFSIVVPGAGGVLVPWLILTHGSTAPEPATWPAVGLIAVGAVLYLACLRLFAIVGEGTPGPWDAPRRLVAVGPYRWVRNPIYIGAILVVLGEAWLFLSVSLMEYAAAMAVGVHLFVVGYEEPTLGRTFGESYAEYRRTVMRWLPRRPPSR
jgi:protein-S-isoprenylcysteine O-methyltransferase Ste14